MWNFWRLFCTHKKGFGLQSPRCKLIPLEHIKGLWSLDVIYLWKDRHTEIRHCDKNLALNLLQKAVSSRNNSGNHCVSLLHYYLGNYLWSLNIQASKKTLPPILHKMFGYNHGCNFAVSDTSFSILLSSYSEAHSYKWNLWSTNVFHKYVLSALYLHVTYEH